MHYDGLTKEQIERAMKFTQSNRAAAQYLGITLNTYKKYAKMYLDEETGINLYDKHKNPYGLGIKKHLKNDPVKEENVLMDILAGKVIPANYTPERLKNRLIKEAMIKEECASCGFNEQRVHDFKVPLVITFRDRDKRNWKFDNLELLCYNCYFLQVGDIFNKKQLQAIQGMHRPNNTSLQEELQIDDSHMYLLAEEYEKSNVYNPQEEDLTGESIIFKL